MGSHSIKVGKYNTKCVCQKCGHLFDTPNTDYAHNKEHKKAAGHDLSPLEVDEKIAQAISVLISKGYNVGKFSQGGWPDYFIETLDGKGEKITQAKPLKDATKMPKFYIRFRMNPQSMRQYKRNASEEMIAIYADKYWEYLGTMITTLPNAFKATFVYESKQDTLPRATIRQSKPRTRELVITWINGMSIKELGSDQELYTMMEYSYKKLLDWANELPDINAYMLEMIEEDK